MVKTNDPDPDGGGDLVPDLSASGVFVGGVLRLVVYERESWRWRWYTAACRAILVTLVTRRLGAGYVDALMCAALAVFGWMNPASRVRVGLPD